MKRLLVTGADGFVGRWLVRAALAEGLEVVAAIGPGGKPPSEWLDKPDADRVEWFELDITSADGLQRVADCRADAVVHLAAVASGAAARRDPALASRVNTDAAVSLTRALVQGGNPVRLLFVSTGEVYGAGHGEPIAEDAAVAPVSPYAGSKADAERGIAEVVSGSQVELVIARPFPHTGPGQSTDFVVPAFAARIRQAAQDGSGEIAVGNLDVTRDFLDVRDVVRAYLLLLRHGAGGEVYNVASGVGQRLDQVLALLTRLVGTQVRPVVDPELVRPADIPVLVGDATKLRRVTGWSPSINLEQTFRDLLDAQAD